MRRAESALFAPYRSVGVVCNEVRPSFARFLGQNDTRRYYSMLCAVDNVCLRYYTEKLGLTAISDVFPEPVTHVMCTEGAYYGVSGTKIGVMPFCRDITRWIDIQEKPKHCLLFGDQFVIVDVNNGIRVINVEDGEQVLHLEGSEHFDISAITHPPTYINKVLVASKEGKLRLYNTRTGKLVHEFARQFDAEITVLQPTPALDVVAVGLKNGRVVLHNVKIDKTVTSFKHDHAITAIGFRTDGQPLMTSADTTGMIAVWDLEKKELVGRISDAHKAAVTCLFFLPDEPVMVSSSADNSIRTWVLDQADGMPRQHVVLEGHSDAVSAIRFSDQHQIVSAGLDGSVRRYHATNVRARQKLGNAGTMRRAIAKKRGIDLDSIKLEPVCDIALSWNRENKWDNVLCRHSNTLICTTWSTKKSVQGTLKLVHKRFFRSSALQHASATSIAVSACGNFAFIGTSTGHVDQFNIQSGRFVKTFVDFQGVELEIDPKTGKKVLPKDGQAHKAAVNGMSIDALGHELVTGCADGRLKFWDLSTGELKAKMRAKSGISRMATCQANSLLAVTLLDPQAKSSSVSLIDVITRRIVRTFKHVGDEVLAMDFSPDGRWLLTADEKSYIRVWELTTSSLIDVMLYGAPCIGISFNTTGEFLATCHQGEKAVYIWANKCQFIGNVSIRALPLDYAPKWDGSEEENMDAQPIISEEETSSSEQLDPNLVTYSGLAPSRWANLPDISIIKERNKPSQPIKKPARAPFFLTADLTLEGFEFEKNDESLEKEKRKTLQAKRSLLELESSFSGQLRRCETTEELIECFAHLKQMSVSAADFQLRSLAVDVLPVFMRMLLEVLRSKKDFDLVQAYLAAAIKIHRAELWAEGEDGEELTQILEQLRDEEQKIWDDLDSLLTKNSAIIQWTKSALI